MYGFQTRMPRNSLKWIGILYLAVTVVGICIFALCKALLPSGEPMGSNQYGHDDNYHIVSRWGNLPTNEKCYRQKSTAILLAVFVGSLAVDQWYAHNWVLATFKFLTGGFLGVWSLVDIILWTIGGVYTTPGCPA